MTKRRAFKRWIAGLSALVMLLTIGLALPVGARAEKNTVRVLLTRLNLTDRVDLWLDGVYTASTGGEAIMAFPQGSQITLQVRGGSLYLFYQGMSLQVGTTLQLIQNQSGGSGQEGLRFADAGDLCRDGGAVQLIQTALQRGIIRVGGTGAPQ